MSREVRAWAAGFVWPPRFQESQRLQAAETPAPQTVEKWRTGNLYATFLSDSVGYIQIRQMLQEPGEDMKVVRDFMQAARSLPDLIIDIRGNQGGSDMYWRTLVGLLAESLSAPVLRGIRVWLLPRESVGYPGRPWPRTPRLFFAVFDGARQVMKRCTGLPGVSSRLDVPEAVAFPCTDLLLGSCQLSHRICFLTNVSDLPQNAVFIYGHTLYPRDYSQRFPIPRIIFAVEAAYSLDEIRNHRRHAVVNQTATSYHLECEDAVRRV